MSWQVKSLNKVCDIYNGGTPKTDVSEYWDGDVFWITPKDLGKLDDIYINDTERKITDLGLKKSSAKLLPVNTLILSSRAPIGHLGISKIPICTNQGCKGIVVGEKENDVKYVYYFLLKSKKLLNDLGAGTTFKELSASKLEQVIIPVPPLSEQQKIVEKLDAAFALIDRAKANLEQNLQNAKELFQSKLNEVFSQKGEGWEEKRLGEIGKVSMCKRIFKDQTQKAGDIPFYKIGTFGKQPDAFISKEVYEDFKSRFSFPSEGDVLISASGTIGRRVVFDGRPAYFQDSNIVWIANDEKNVSNEFLYHYYGACKWGSTKGATISRLYNDNLKKMTINFPQSLETQQKLVSQLDALSAQTEQLQQKYTQKLANLEELRKSVLERAFREGV